MSRRRRLRRRDQHRPPTLESLQAELKGLRIALLALGLAIIAVGVVVAVLLFGRAPRQAYVDNQLRTLTCLAVLRLPDTHPTARDLRAAYHCPPYAPIPSRTRSSSPPPAAASAPAARRSSSASRDASRIPARPVASSGRATRHLEASTVTAVRRDTSTRTVTATPSPSTVTASPSGLLGPLCNLAADLRIC